FPLCRSDPSIQQLRKKLSRKNSFIFCRAVCIVEIACSAFVGVRCAAHWTAPATVSLPWNPLVRAPPSLWNPQGRKTPLPRLFVLVCAVAHAGAPVGGCRADHGPPVRLRCAAHRKLSTCLRRLRSYFFVPIRLTTIGSDVLCSSRRNARSLRSADGGK